MDNYVFGVDLGGTTVKIGLFETDGTLCETREIPTRKEHDGAAILGDISGSIREMIAGNDLTEEQIIGIGMGVPGPVDREGTVNKCVNLGWGVFNVEQEMQELLGFKTKASNDANAAALGEMWMGGGKGYRDIVMITLGTGIGGGVIVDGKIAPGFNGAAGEIGHFTVNEDEPEACACGKHGCLEQYTSARGVARMAKKFLEEHDDETILREYTMDEISAKEVFDAAKAQDPVALRLVEEFGKMMGKALAQTACVINPQIFVIGGGVSKAGDIVLDVIRKYYVQYAFHASRDTLFKLASLGNKAGIYGGARMILDETGNV